MVALTRRRKLVRTPMWPLDAPGMPMPGPNFLRTAAESGDEVELKPAKKGAIQSFVPGEALTAMYRQALREPGFVLKVQTKPNTFSEVTFVPGHIWGQHNRQWRAHQDDFMVEVPPVDGPHRADVMVLGKIPWVDEVKAQRNLVGPSGEILANMIVDLHIDDADLWYVTNLVKFMPPDGTTKIRAAWIKDCMPLLHQELRLVRPRYILCLGADASKALLGKKFNVSYMEGRVVPYTYPIHRHADDEPVHHTAQVMTIMHPAEAAREQAKARIVERGMSRFSLLISGVDFAAAETDLDHRVIDTYEDAVRWVEEINAEFVHVPRKDRLVAWDAEWQGQHPCNRGSYLRTIQASWAPKCAVCFKIAHAGGKVAFRDEQGRPAVKRLMALLQEFMRDKRAVGHFLVADLEWLVDYGFDPTAHCRAPLDPDKKGRLAWERLRRGEGWLDTAMMAHAIEETAPLGLESLAMRYSTAPRYDIPLEDWKKEYCRVHKISTAALEGYGDCPDEVLIPYANYDADVTLRICLALLPLLDYDYEGNCCWEPCWESMIIQPAILTIHQNGIKVNRQRIDELSVAFLEARSIVEDRIRDWAEWPEFNIRSVQHVREFLFGTRLNGKIDAKGRNERIRPPGAKSLEVEPLLDTSKPPRRWAEIKAKGQEQEASPTTGKMVLSILAQDNPAVSEQILWLRDYRFLDQVLKSVLRPPKTELGVPTIGDDGFFEYDKGLVASIDDDGRVRTHIYPTAETRRWKSARPNLQNLCVDAATEYLTARGWVPAPALRPNDRVAEYWPDDRSIDFVKPSAVVVQHHRGSMRKIATDEQIDLLVTPNHRCLLRNRKSGKWFETPAAEFRSYCQHLHAGSYGGGKKSLSAAEVTWLCAVQADGSYVKGGGIKFGLRKARKFERLAGALRTLGAGFTETRNGIYVGVSDMIAADLVATAKLRLGSAKVFGPWLLDLDRATIDLFVEELFHWDGLFTRRTEFSSSDKQSADWAQILFALSGIRARMRTYDNGNPGARLHYCVDVPSRRVDYSLTTNFMAEEVPWDDKVYCVTVPSEFIVIRRNGKVSITGNSKSRDPDYKRILGDRYKNKIRSIFVAEEGYALVEFDYTGAELYGMALMSGDETMINHAQRALLPDEGYNEHGNPVKGGKYPHPDYYDIHSNVAVLAFQLDCLPTKAGLKAIGKTHFRTLAKNVIFGIAYGRGAKAIALQAREQGVQVTPDEAQLVIDTIFAMYPGLVPFFAEAKRRATEEKWLCHCFGAFRRFIRTGDYKLEGEFERQAMNFPIQGMIASAVDRGLARLHHVIEKHGLQDEVRLILQIHDAGLLEVRYDLIPWVIETLIPYAMQECVPIYPTTLDGVPTGEGPFRLGLEVTIEKSWGSEKLPLEICREYGIPEKYAA